MGSDGDAETVLMMSTPVYEYLSIFVYTRGNKERQL